MQRRFFLTMLAAGAGASALAGCNTPPSYTGIDITGVPYGRDFRLKDPDGRERTLADYKGKYVLMFFGFTQCPDVCPTALARATEIRKELGKAGEKLQVLFITVDPERDTPPLLREYTAAFDPSFVGLSGDLARTREVADEFKIIYKKVPSGESYTMDHTALSYVLDTEGKMRLAWRHAQTAAECVADMRALMKSDSSIF